jgi:LCP family protein required for cell wall assembly
MPSPPAKQGDDAGTHARHRGPGLARPAGAHARPRTPRRLGRILLAVGVTLVLIAGLALLGSYVALHRYDRAVQRGNLLAPSARAQQHASVRGPLNFLLIGSDYRTWAPGSGQRSDTIIIAHVPAGLDHAYLISIPRDLRVEMPPDPALNFAGDITKINAAFEFGGGGQGGIQLLSSTLTTLTGIRFDGAAVVSFTGLQKAVGVVGGVNMCVDERTVSIHTGAVFERGCRLMPPAEILDYLRQRQFADGDFSRQRHQQQFLKSLLDRMVSAGVLANPLKLDALLRAVAGSMTIDIGSLALPDLVFALRDLRPEAVTGIRVPATIAMIGDTSFVIATNEAAGLYAALRNDSLASWVTANQQWVNQI